MKNKILLSLLIGLALFLGTIPIFSQDEDIDSMMIFDEGLDFDIDESFNMKNSVIEVLYGMGKPSIHNDVFKSDFANTNSLEARFGYSDKKAKYQEDNIYEYDFKHLLLANMSSAWAESNDTKTLNTESWQFGFSLSEGYGYKISENTDITLFSSKAFTWTSTNFKDKPVDTLEQDRLDYIGSGFRFGDYFEGGVKMQVYRPFGIIAGYQRGIVMPRTLFWKWLGSGLIEGVGDLLIGEFTKQVFKTSPKFGPIVYFVLQNAYQYGYYELRKKYMNWPFVTETPFMYEQYKVGLSFDF